MQKRHDDLLTTRLEEVVDNGVSHIHWHEIKRWYGAKRIAANTYADIQARWKELSQSSGDLMCVQSNSGVFLMGEKSIHAFGK